MIRLAVRILPVFAIIIGFAVTLAAYMNFSGVRTAYLELVRARMEMIAGAVATDVAAASSSRHRAAGRMSCGTVSDDVPVLRHSLQITNDLGGLVGTIAVRLDRAGIDAALDRLRLDIFASALPAGLGAVGAGCLMALLLLSGLHRRARRFSEQNQSRDPISHAEKEVAQLGLGSAA